MALPSRVETVVVGAGQAGLIMSWHLNQAGRDHLVLERRAAIGGGWQDRWDAFRLVTPNWSTGFPGFPYDDPDPDGFMPRDEVVGRVARYARASHAPVVTEAGVRRLTLAPGGGFRIETDQGELRAERVVVATGSFHQPRIPAIAAALPKRLTHIHSHVYRRPTDLPDGAVLIVGSGQSGVQLAEELAEAGRSVFISVGSAGRIPRRYRGRDFFAWFRALAVHGHEVGVALPSVDSLPDPRMRFAANPALSGHGGGHDTNLREFARRGMTLLGRIDGVAGERLELAPDLPKNLAWTDASFGERFQPLIDRYIDAAAIDAPPDDRVTFAFDPPLLDSLDLAAVGITGVLWTSGYRMDYGWIDLPIFDGDGYPRQRRGVTDVPGLYFVGLLWQHTQASATLMGVDLDARHIAGAIGLPIEPPDSVSSGDGHPPDRLVR